MPTDSTVRTRRPDLVLLVVVAALLVIGLDMVYSASFVIAHNSPLYSDDTYFLMRQLTWVAIGTVAMLSAMRIDYRRWRPLTLPILMIVLVMLLAVVVSRLGHSAYGAQRWLKLGPLPPVQPSEFAKLALILYYASWLSRRRGQLGTISTGPMPFAVSLLAVGGLIMLQPDFGSTFVILVVAVCLFFIAGASLRHLFAGVLLGSGVLALLTLSAGYRSQRIAAFLNPGEDPLGIGWHINQAAIALGSGGIFGLGLGASRQKFYYLPSAHTDAIYAVIGEELGLMGTLGVLGLFCLLAYRGYRIALGAPDSFGALLAAGITSWLIFQALINIAVVTATVPFTGIPLPFVSFGGSSALVSMVAVGILLNISRYPSSFRPDKNRLRGAEPDQAMM